MLTTASDFFESLVSASRAGVGDDLRSLVYLTPESAAVLYTRADLSAHTDRVIDDGGGTLGGNSSALGDHELTVHVANEGFVSRVVVGDHGVLATTDEIDADAFREVAVTLRKLLADAPTPSAQTPTDHPPHVVGR